MITRLHHKNPREKAHAIFISLVLAVVAGVSMLVLIDAWKPRLLVQFGDTTLRAEVADTPTARQQGLSNRYFLMRDLAMLFIFPHDGRHAIWMKNMNFPIDVVWLDDQKRVVDSRENIAPSSYPEHFLPKKDARYVLEVGAHQVAEHHIVPGMKIEFEEQK